MRIGIVLNMTFNFPLKMIELADCGLTKEQSGDIYLKLSKDTKIAIFHLWPHARPGRWAVPQPALRGIKNCPEVAKILVDAWAAQNNVIARTVQAGESNQKILRIDTQGLKQHDSAHEYRPDAKLYCIVRCLITGGSGATGCNL